MLHIEHTQQEPGPGTTDASNGLLVGNNKFTHDPQDLQHQSNEEEIISDFPLTKLSGILIIDVVLNPTSRSHRAQHRLDSPNLCLIAGQRKCGRKCMVKHDRVKLDVDSTNLNSRNSNTSQTDPTIDCKK